MYQINLNNPCTVFFIGIGGISMSGFAQLLHENGFNVCGSDMKESKITDHLESLGINIIYGQKTENITADIDFVVYTAAIHPDNPEFVRAKELGIPMMERAEMVGQVMKNYPNAIGISGTHGKTTTTSMLSQIFLAAKKDPTISVGGILDAIGGNIRIGHSENFITEACEYTNSFLKFHPTAGIILNVDADHLDFFKASDISFDEKGHGCYTLIRNGQKTDMQIKLNVVGRHNISNSLSAIALSEYYGIDEASILNGLSDFVGTERRFELKGTFNGVTVIDDYAHHPTEIAATLAAAQKYPHKHLWCVFQPHTYSRTRALLKEFAQALSLAENIVLADIYAAREQDPGDISSKTLQAELEKLGKKAYYFPSFDEIEKFLLENCINGDLLITMGAGDVVKIGENLLGK